MDNSIQVLKQTELCGQQFTLYGTPETPLFRAKDVAKIIEHSDVSTMVQSVDEDEKLLQTMLVAGQNRQVWMLTEEGLYEVLFQSRKPIAKLFKKGVKAILKEIRTKGGYIAAGVEDTDEEIMARALLVADATIKRKDERIAQLQAENETAQKQIEEQQSKIEQDAPKVLFADAVSTSQRSCLVAELAKILKQNGVDIGQNRLYGWLRSNGYLGARGLYYNQPTQKAMKLGLFEIKQTTITKPDGTVLVATTPKITGKGQIYFVDKFLSRKGGSPCLR